MIYIQGVPEFHGKNVFLLHFFIMKFVLMIIQTIDNYRLNREKLFKIS